MRQKTVLEKAVPALVKADGTLATNETGNIELLSIFFPFTNEPPGEWKILDVIIICQKIDEIKITEKTVKQQ